MKKITSLLLALLMVFMVSMATAESQVVERGAEVVLNVSLTAASGYTAKIGINVNGAPVTFKEAKGGPTNDVYPPQTVNGFFVPFNLDYLTLNPDGSIASEGTPTAPKPLETGVIGTVIFTVDTNAPAGEYTISAFVEEGTCTVEGSVTFTVEEGTARLPGDVNLDTVIDIFDLAIIEMYFEGYAIDIDEQNADVNADAIVDIFDLALFEMYFEGYPVTFE